MGPRGALRCPPGQPVHSLHPHQFLPKARGKLQPACTCSGKALHPSTQVGLRRWLVILAKCCSPGAVLSLEKPPPSQHACHSVSLLLSPPVDPDTTTRVPRSSVLTAATSAAQGQVNTEQANVICDYSFYFYFGSGSRKIWLGQ